MTRLVGAAISSSSQWNAFIGQPEKVRRTDGLIIVRAGSTQVALDFSVEEPLPLPELIRQEPRLHNLSRSWLNTFQYRTDIGILSNNTVSDNAIFACSRSPTRPYSAPAARQHRSDSARASRSIDISREHMDTASAWKIDRRTRIRRC